jgi:hypothetical protein
MKYRDAVAIEWMNSSIVLRPLRPAILLVDPMEFMPGAPYSENAVAIPRVNSKHWLRSPARYQPNSC